MQTRNLDYKFPPFRRLMHMGAKGWGLVAAGEIPAEALVCEYVGEVVGVAEAERRAGNYAKDGLLHTFIMNLR